MTIVSHFENFQTIIDIHDTELKKICDYFSMLDGDAEALVADMKSFTSYIKSMLDSGI
jgi:hypothetical protein